MVGRFAGLEDLVSRLFFVTALENLATAIIAVHMGIFLHWEDGRTRNTLDQKIQDSVSKTPITTSDH